MNLLNKLKDKLRNQLEDINIWYTHTILYPYWDFIEGVKNCWKYRKIIWNDRWYDYSYIFTLLEFKLQDNIKQWDKSHYTGCHFTKLRMIVLLNRLKNYREDLDELHEQHYKQKITKSQYLINKNELLNKTWKSLGRNITRFWD